MARVGHLREISAPRSSALVQRRISFWNRPAFEQELRRQACDEKPNYSYRTSDFEIEDWDFDDIQWRHWEALAKSRDATIWNQIVERLLAQPDAFWTHAQIAQALHVATTGKTRAVVSGPILPTWVMTLRALPCLPDTHGSLNKPEDLLLRTPMTEALLGVEPFVHGRLDCQASRVLLSLLGVRDRPIGPQGLLARLRALAGLAAPPVQEVEKWYRRLDQLTESCPSADLGAVKDAFRNEKIVLAESGAWRARRAFFSILAMRAFRGPSSSPRRCATCRSGLRLASLSAPTADLAIAWLKQLPAGKPLPTDDIRRVRAALARHAARIFLNLSIIAKQSTSQ